LRIDRSAADGCSGWRTPLGLIYMNWYDPDCTELTDEQENYSSSYIADFETALFSETFSDQVIGYRRFIDLNSFLDYLIINEIAKNVDACRLSTYLYKDRDSKGGKLTMGPVWDFDIAFGNVDVNNGFRTDSLVAPLYPWWNRFLQDTLFTRALGERWMNHRVNSLTIHRIMSLIDSLSIFLNEAQQRNFERWDILETEIWPNYFVGGSYEAEIEYLKGWLVNRINWLDNYFGYSTSPIIELSNNSLLIYPNPFYDFFTL